MNNDGANVVAKKEGNQPLFPAPGLISFFHTSVRFPAALAPAGAGNPPIHQDI
jgi:hypothetical protein